MLAIVPVCARSLHMHATLPPIGLAIPDSETASFFRPLACFWCHVFHCAAVPQGYGMTPNVTTWGGNIIYDAASQAHHMFVSRMTNDCPLDDWTENSRIDHAVSTTGPTGPYKFQDVAINTWAHNAAPIVLKDGSYAIIHIGTGEVGSTVVHADIHMCYCCWYWCWY